MKRKRITGLLLIAFLTSAGAQETGSEATQGDEPMNRIETCKKNYTALFGGEALSGHGADAELMDILQKFIFGEVFRTGNLDVKTREMITVVTLASLQTLPQLKAHAHAALNAGVTSVELREAVYQCAPIIGFPRTLNAMDVLNDVYTEKEIELPLENQVRSREEERFSDGSAIQTPLYGDEIREALWDLPDGLNEAVPRFLTEVCFGDFYTRGGLDIRTRELLTLCVLAALGADRQIRAHAAGALRAGNDKATLYAAMVQCLPYIGFPAALNAIYIIQSVERSALHTEELPDRQPNQL